jgi:hypothetical protein
MPALKGRTRRLQRRALSHLCSPYSRPIAWSLDPTAECRTPLSETLQFIVIAVMSVMGGTFSRYLRGFLHDGGLLACLGTVMSWSW